MANSIWTTEEFTCPGCGMNYTAIKEERSDKHSGAFKCRSCNAEVHAWSGYHGFFDWKVVKARSHAFGKRWADPSGR